MFPSLCPTRKYLANFLKSIMFKPETKTLGIATETPAA
jgi:hypothetical protein